MELLTVLSIFCFIEIHEQIIHKEHSQTPMNLSLILCCSNQLEMLDVLKAQVHFISLPIKLKSVFLVSEDRWLLLESDTNK